MTSPSRYISAELFGIGAMVLLSSFGCNAVKTATSPGGEHQLECPKGMESCINKASKICGDEGYMVLRGVSRKQLLGGESSSYRAISESAELSIRCGLEVEEPEQATYQLPPRTDEPVEASVQRVSRAICVPGATQACVGPGGCRGGQVCATDGLSYGLCDCGESSRPVVEEKTEKKQLDHNGAAAPVPAEDSALEVPGAAPAPSPLQAKPAPKQ